MTKAFYVEDAILILFSKIINFEISVDHMDIGPISNLSKTVEGGKFLTKKQGNFVIKLLSKYQYYLEPDIANIDTLINFPMWKHPFRVVDNSKVLFIDDDDSESVIYAKFPYSFKEIFSKDFFPGGTDKSVWDSLRQVRKIKLKDINLILFIETATKHGFEISENINELVAYSEEIWHQEEKIIPFSKIENNQVILKNAAASAINYWNNNCYSDTNKNLLLAKRMGFLLKDKTIDSTIKKLCSTPARNFWCADKQKFYDLIDELNLDPVVIVLDRSSNTEEWVKTFVRSFNLKNYNLSDIRICFRPSNSDKKGKEFNDWLKNQNLNQKVSSGKIFICQHKIPKWMLLPENNFDIKILGTNAIYQNPNSETAGLFDGHYAVFYLENAKPSLGRNKEIVEL